MVISLPKSIYSDDDEGIVLVKITVDKSGNVTAVESGAHRTKLINKKFLYEAKKAALKTMFNVDNYAPAFNKAQYPIVLYPIKLR